VIPQARLAEAAKVPEDELDAAAERWVDVAAGLALAVIPQARHMACGLYGKG